MEDKQQLPTYICGLDLGQVSDFSAFSVLERTTLPVPEYHDPEPQVTVSAATGKVIDTPAPSGPKPKRPWTPRRYSYALRALDRYDVGTSYVTIVERVVSIFSRPPLAGGTLVIDHTGVGRPVYDMFAKAAVAGVECSACNGSGLVADKRQPGSYVCGTEALWGDGDKMGCLTCQATGRIKGKFHCRPITITAGGKANEDGAGWRVPKKELVGVLQVLLQSKRLKIAAALQFAAILKREMENFRVKITAASNESFEAWREKDHDDLVLATSLACWVGEKGLAQFWMK